MDDEITLRESVSKRIMKIGLDEITMKILLKMDGLMCNILLIVRKIRNRTKTDSGTQAEHAKAIGE